MVKPLLRRPSDYSANYYPDDMRFELEDGLYFVFGSNRQGIHGKGAAKTALEDFGAVWGQGEGMQGRSYALPTKSSPYVSLSLHEIQQHVDKFRMFVNDYPLLTFFMTAVGCGLAGYKTHEIAPMFKGIPRTWFPASWKPFLET